MFLATDFRPLTGGIAEYLHGLAHHLGRRLPVTVMTTVEQNGASWERAYRLVQLPPLPDRRLGRRIGDGIPVVRKLHTGAYFLSLRAQARRLADQVRVLGDQAVAVIGSWDTASHFWCDACRRSGVPYVLATYGAEVLLPLYGRLPAWRKEDFAKARRVFACSRATGDLAAERFDLASPPEVVHPVVGSRPPDDRVRARAAALRRELNIGEGPMVFSLGRLVRRKGFDLMLHALNELSRECPTLSAVIAGEGTQAHALARLARELGLADRVRLVGGIDDLTKWALYDLCDLFVMPNRSLGGADWEGFGLVFLEAALSRRPSIGGRTGGTSDAVLDKVTGLLVDPEDPEELRRALGRLLADKELRQRMGCAGREFALTRFSGEAVAERLLDVLQ